MKIALDFRSPIILYLWQQAFFVRDVLQILFITQRIRSMASEHPRRLMVLNLYLISTKYIHIFSIFQSYWISTSFSTKISLTFLRSLTYTLFDTKSADISLMKIYETSSTLYFINFILYTLYRLYFIIISPSHLKFKRTVSMSHNIYDSERFTNWSTLFSLWSYVYIYVYVLFTLIWRVIALYKNIQSN